VPKLIICSECGKRRPHEVRGLLCDDCNRAVGLMQDDQSLLLRAVKYLGKALR